jgi:hypothetical protein
MGRAALAVAGQVRPGPRVRGAVGVASLLTVAIVPGAAMAAGAITVAADAYCTYGSFCLYSGPNFNGDKVEYTRDQLFCEDSKPALDVRSVLPGGARSVVNNTRTATAGLGVKIYSSPGNLVLTTVSPGGEVQDLGGDTARAMQSLCVFPKNPCRSRNGGSTMTAAMMKVLPRQPAAASPPSAATCRSQGDHQVLSAVIGGEERGEYLMIKLGGAGHGSRRAGQGDRLTRGVCMPPLGKLVHGYAHEQSR